MTRLAAKAVEAAAAVATNAFEARTLVSRVAAAELEEKTIALIEAWATKINEIVLLDPSRSVYQVPGRTGGVKCMYRNHFCKYILATRVAAHVHHEISPF